MENDKKHVIPRDRYKRRRRVFTEDGQEPMAPYEPAADSDESSQPEELGADGNEEQTARSAAEMRREHLEEENGRSHDPVYGYEDLEIDDEAQDNGYQDVYTSGPAASGGEPDTGREQEAARETQADEVLRAEEPADARPENKTSAAGAAQTQSAAVNSEPEKPGTPEQPQEDSSQGLQGDDTPNSGIFAGAAGSNKSTYKYPGDESFEDTPENSTQNNPDNPQNKDESAKRIQRDERGRVVRGDPKSSGNNNDFYGTVPPAGGSGSGSGSNAGDGGNGNNRGRKGGGDGGFFRLFLIPLIAGLLGALVVLLLFNVFGGNNDPEETATNEQEAGTGEQSQDQAVEQVTETETTEAIEGSRDSVVSVINLQRVESFLPGMFGEDAQTQQQEPEEAGIGSGVIYKTEGETAYIVTNFHVVEGAEELQINMQNGESLTAEVVGTDIWTDLAVLSIPSEQVEGTLDFADSSELTVGQSAIAIGSPLGEAFSGSVSQGIVSGLDRSVPVDLDGDGSNDWEANVIQTDAAINPGNSGGALIDSNGNLIGINSMKISMPQVEGIGFAIPANEVQQVVTQIEENGEVQRPFLGVTLQDLYTIPPEVLANDMNLPEDVNSGVVVSSVQQGSPAGNAGMQQLDVVTALDGNTVNNMMELRQYLYYEKEPGEEMTVDFYRSGEQQTVTVTLQ